MIADYLSAADAGTPLFLLEWKATIAVAFEFYGDSV
jgi:hypothetical protein